MLLTGLIDWCHSGRDVSSQEVGQSVKEEKEEPTLGSCYSVMTDGNCCADINNEE